MKIGSLCTGLLLLGMVGYASAAPTACVATAGTNCPARILDAPQAAVVSTVNVPALSCPDSSPLLSVAVNVTHSAVGDLTITVANPNGDTATLLSNLPGSSGPCRGSDIAAIFSDGEAAPACSMIVASVGGPLAPVTPLAPLIATPPEGIWALTIVDGANNGDGVLNDWSVDVSCAPVIPPPAATAVSTPISWQALAVIAVLLALAAFAALRRRSGFVR
jgi:subtilisin-like proprotein convertase family protein